MKKSKIIVVAVVLAALLVVINSNNNVFGYSWSGTGPISGGGNGGGGGGCPSRDYTTPTVACGVSWIYYKYSGTPYAQSNSNDSGPEFKFQPHRNNDNLTIPSACSVTGGFWHLGSTIKWDSTRWGTTDSLTSAKSESYLWEYENGKYGHADTWTWKVSKWKDFNLDSAGTDWLDSDLGHTVKVDGLSGKFDAAYFGTYNSVWESYKENIDGSASGIPLDVYAFCANDPKKPDVNNVDTSSRMRVTGPKLDTGWHESGRDSITKNRNVVRVVQGDKATVETKHKGFRSAETSSDKVNFEASIATIIKQGENLDTTVTKKGDGSDFGSTWTFAANATEKEWAATNSRGLSFEPDSSAWACEGIVHKEKVDSKGKTSGNYEKSGYCEFIYRPPANFTGKITATVVAKNASGATLDTKTKSTDEGGSIAITLPENSGKYSVNFTQSVTRKDLSSYGSAGGTMKAEIKSYTKRTDFFRKENDVTIDLIEGQTQQTFGNNNTKNVRTLGYSSDNQYGGISGELYYGESVKYCSHLNTVSWLKKRSPVDYDNKYICVTISRPSKKCSVKTKEKVNIQEYGVNAGRNYGSIGVKNYSNGQSESTTITSADGAVGPVLGNVFAKPGDSIQFEYNMCAGAFYTAQANDLGSRNNTDYGSRYGAEGQLEHGAPLGTFKTNGQDGYLFKKSLPMVDSVYHNPARYVQIRGRDWRWSDGQKAESPMKSGKFMTNTTAHPWFASAEDTETSPDINDTTYECTHQKTNNNNTSAKKEANAYQVSGKQSTNSGSSKCHTSIGNIFDVGGTISQSLYWNNLRLDVTGTSRTVKAFGANQDAVATAYVKVPYNYILKPYVKNENGKDKNTRVVYLGETYKMTPGVMTAPRENYRVTFNDNKYATITKETHVKLKTYYIHNGWEYPAGGNAGNAEDIVMRFNRDGYLGEANDVVKTIEFTVPDSDNAANNAPSVGDKICTDITVWPADSHDHPDAVYNKANTSNTPNNSSVYKNAGGERGTAQNPYLTIALREDSVRGKENSRTTTSCSMIAKRPTMSVESGNAYSKKGYNMSRYTKNIGGRNYNFSSWSEYGVFGRINKVDEHLISGAAVGYNMDTFYGKENRDKNKARANTNNGSSDANISMNGYSTNTCLFETQTFANADCNAKNEIDIGGQSVTDYKQKILDRYKADGNNVECDGDIEYEEYEYRDGKRVKTIKKYCKVQNLGEGNGLMKYTKNNGSSAIVVKADKNIYIEDENGSIPANIPKYFTDEKAKEGKDNQIDFNRTLVYDASGQDIVIDGDIAYNENEKSNLDDIVGVVIIAKNVYFTNKPTHIDAVIIAEEEVNTCKYANGIEMMIDDGATLNSDVCNQSLIFEAPVITKKLVLNRTAGADNGIESIKRAEIFNLNMANYLWSFNQMSRYSQAVTTYSRELPSRY